ncbi:hypothetical protein [Thalassospira lucentensis]|uniref:hypothetical protein n=1 Tax=Thalassospira lucentensis TaxID=168935 RepID=UPI003AA85C8E
MNNIVLLATGWGPQFGGVNAFNHDLAIGLASELGDSGMVFCVVPNPKDSNIENAKKNGVTLIPLFDKNNTEKFDTGWVLEASKYLENSHPGVKIDWWVGHDLKSGDAAVYAAQNVSGNAALIQHMSYINYSQLKDGPPTNTIRKHEEQKKLFKSKAALFAVGPKLTKECEALSGAKVTQLVPGFPEFTSQNNTTHKIVAITFGRMDAASDRIKQGGLAVSAFSEALNFKKEEFKISTLSSAQLYLIGMANDAEEEVKTLQAKADELAGRVVNLLALPFDEDRESLFRRLAEANLAMMLSWHDGFGLTGWEAIAAEVPLIIGENTGVFDLINETLGDSGTACVQKIDVRGRRGNGSDESNFAPDDLQDVKEAIRRIASDLPKFKKNAQNLKKYLIDELTCTWSETAKVFLEALISNQTSDSSIEKTEKLKTPSENLSTHGPFDIVESGNAIPLCAELLLSVGQGSTFEEFEPLPEVRFGRAELDEIKGFSISYGLKEAFLRLHLKNCNIRPGMRLGDDIETQPHIVAQGDNTWAIRGPKDGDVLARRAIGSEALCYLEAEPNKCPEVKFELYCRKRDLSYEIFNDDNNKLAPNKDAILKAFLTKILEGEGSNAILSKAKLIGRDKEHETD